MVKASDVTALNAKIKKLNSAKTKADAQKELLTERLESELEGYKSKYGKDLKGKTFESTVKAIESELSKVSKKVTEEYELKNKIVEALENGEYDVAYKLLGVEPKAATKPEESLDEITEESAELEEDEGSSSTEDLEELLDSLEDEEEPEVPALSKPSDSPQAKVKPKPVDLSGLDVDEEEDPLVQKLVSQSSNTLKPTKQAKPAVGTLSLGNISLGDDEDEGEDMSLGVEDFGFGKALSGSQFQA